MRLGNFIEVGNDVFMHIIATNDFSATRPRPTGILAATSATASSHSGRYACKGGDIRCRALGATWYRKARRVQIALEQRTHLDGNTSGDHFNSSATPAATDIFSRASRAQKHRAFLPQALPAGTISSRRAAAACASALAQWTQDQAGYIGRQ